MTGCGRSNEKESRCPPIDFEKIEVEKHRDNDSEQNKEAEDYAADRQSATFQFLSLMSEIFNADTVHILQNPNKKSASILT
ncbi:hypothetical protein [Rhizobium sp. BR 314]|uniref:hypothetical protein n=1 Tax=Rhizobium sp. BR 314 TaxID=3040013 RepID=UPI0039BFA80C